MIYYCFFYCLKTGMTFNMAWAWPFQCYKNIYGSCELMIWLCEKLPPWHWQRHWAMPWATLIVLSAIMTILCLTAVILNSTVIMVALQHKQMHQPLKFTQLYVSSGNPDLHCANRRFAICCGQHCMLTLASWRCKYELTYSWFVLAFHVIDQASF